ncbi:uncharacterized protein LOC100162290 precursor [Acyrthosiphon pisum]|uniref:ACYPI003450 protein n=1 Tax=Acyrthosiphon pisum TaxID=7029 RepID=C4WUB6_ACYPI|nr:uncharacterized protein LOC100162290 precursor [Acyrthosiphon pisum]BAH71486.1 ACYPI003450 [Acyrthosiphon pisum]|eukprot:NP_001156140.1 uncharacterized protein LOC100162290 precursor [Acyrthosiphon pisum]
MLRDNVNAQVACAVLLLIGAVVVDNVGASTKYTLLGKNQIEVTESMVTCKNGKSVSVTTGVKGELYALSTTRTSFSGDKWKRRMAELDRESDDEQGHVVASVFGGPVETWNLVPQHRSVNRKINAQSSLLNRWDEFEKWTREQLGKKNGAPVKFTIKIKYATKNGCRPIGFEIDATSKAGPGFQGRFDNGPYGTFAIASNKSSKKKP